MSTKFAHYAAFAEAGKQVDRNMRDFVQRFDEASRTRSTSKASASTSENKGSQPNKARTSKR